MRRELVTSENNLEFTVISVSDDRVTIAFHTYFADECKSVSISKEHAERLFRVGSEVMGV